MIFMFLKKQYLADVTKKKIGQLEDYSSLYTMNHHFACRKGNNSHKQI
jgi:hypothetical protein